MRSGKYKRQLRDFVYNCELIELHELRPSSEPNGSLTRNNHGIANFVLIGSQSNGNKPTY